MRFLLAVWAAVAVCPCLAAAPGAPELYQTGQFEEASRLFAEKVKTDPFDAHAHYNLANSDFRLGRLGAAVVEYLRAFELAPRDSDIRYNLDFALQKTGDRLIPSGVPSGLFILFHLLSSIELSGIALLFLWAFGLAFSAHALSARRHAILHRGCAVFLGGLLFFGAWWGARRLSGYHSPGVVVVGEAEARSGPGLTFSVAFTLPEGRRVEVLQERDGWLEVGVLSEGIKGWVVGTALEKV